ncbi:hypothetical protein R6Q59_004841 [Mikania micrantha]
MQMLSGSSKHPEEGSPSFFKVIRYPSAPHLVLPKAFVKKYLKKIPKKPTIVTETRGHSWRMEFVKIGEDYCFAHGWEKLVKDVRLCIRDIVIFWLIDSLTFKVIFLGANGCEKDFPFDETNVDDEVVKYDVQDGNVVGGCHDDDGCHNVDNHRHHREVKPDKNLCFEKVFSGKTYKYFMSLPMKFVRAAGLEHTKSIKLKDHQGKEWIMGILVERYSSTKYSLSAGWAKFRQHHNLSDGDVCIFTFNKEEGVLNITQMSKNKQPIEQDTPMEEMNRNRTVKIEDDWWTAEKHCGGGGGGKVKTEDESDSDLVVGKGKSGAPPPEPHSRGGGVEMHTEQGVDRVFRSKHVIYF